METNEKVVYKPSSVPPLQIKQRTTRGQIHLCLSRGTQMLVIILSKNGWTTVQVDGVDESIEQGRKLLIELIGQSSEEEFPRIGVRDLKTLEVSYEFEAEAACLWQNDSIELTNEMLSADFTLRKLLSDERESMIATASYIECTFR